MPKTPDGPKKPKTAKASKQPSARAISRWENEGGASKKLPRKLPDDPIARGVAIMREATGDKSKSGKRKA
jgi:hypothetical protein